MHLIPLSLDCHPTVVQWLSGSSLVVVQLVEPLLRVVRHEALATARAAAGLSLPLSYVVRNYLFHCLRNEKPETTRQEKRRERERERKREYCSLIMNDSYTNVPCARPSEKEGILLKVSPNLPSASPSSPR